MKLRAYKGVPGRGERTPRLPRHVRGERARPLWELAGRARIRLRLGPDLGAIRLDAVQHGLVDERSVLGLDQGGHRPVRPGALSLGSNTGHRPGLKQRAGTRTEDTKKRRDAATGKSTGTTSGKRGTTTRPRSGPADPDRCVTAAARLAGDARDGDTEARVCLQDRRVRGW